MKYCLLFVLTILAASADLPPQSPVIGVYTQVDTSDEPSSSNADLTTYIASSYVKFLEMSGAQVVPIFAYSSETALAALLPKLNGVLFPGGGENISINNRWTANADYILKYAMQENRKGNSFPVWGTCLGMQLLAYLTSGYDEKAISPVRGDTGIINPLDFTSNPSYLFDDVNADLRNKISRGQGLFYFNHKYAVTPSYFDNNRDLNGFWTVVATTTTSYNDKFLSVLQAKDFPFYAVQFHPEKNLFEWKVYADRTPSGAEIAQILGNKFIEKARSSFNRFANAEQFTNNSIYKYKESATKMSFTSVYLFTEAQPAVHLRRQPSNMQVW